VECPTVTPPQCSDGIDNDGDGLIDYPQDPGCQSPQDDDESGGNNTADLETTACPGQYRPV